MANNRTIPEKTAATKGDQNPSPRKGFAFVMSPYTRAVFVFLFFVDVLLLIVYFM